MRYSVLCLLLLSCCLVKADDYALQAPAGWGGETISLPPGFARNMSVRGVEHIRFAPGMMQPASDSFFSYAFVFELAGAQPLKEKQIEAEILKYYRGLCVAVMGGAKPVLPPADFQLTLKNAEPPEGKPGQHHYTATLKWVEPFATRKIQTLNIELMTWGTPQKNYLFACVSPCSKSDGIWKELHRIRDTYAAKNGPNERGAD